MLINDQERFLVGRHLKRRKWECVSGALEANETLVEGGLRELREEMGPDVRAKPLGVIHASSFHYDQNARFMLSVVYVMAYEGGEVRPGDDMSDEFRWLSLEEIKAHTPRVTIPMYDWLFEDALVNFRRWRHRDVELQAPLRGPGS